MSSVMHQCSFVVGSRQTSRDLAWAFESNGFDFQHIHKASRADDLIFLLMQRYSQNELVVPSLLPRKDTTVIFMYSEGMFT